MKSKSVGLKLGSVGLLLRSLWGVWSGEEQETKCVRFTPPTTLFFFSLVLAPEEEYFLI